MKSVITVSTMCLLLVAAAAGAQTPAPKAPAAAPAQPAPAQPAPASRPRRGPSRAAAVPGRRARSPTSI